MRIGLLGGSFNPPHAAHRLISEIALKRLGLTQVWWLVTPGNPLKSKRELLNVGERLEACRRLAADRRIVITDFEKELRGAFTISTLGYLRERHPGVHFVWLMGADNLAGMHRWRQWRDIFRIMPIAVIDRPRWRFKALASPAAAAHAASRWPEAKAMRLATAPAPAWLFLTGPLSDLSSTALRSARIIHRATKRDN